MADDQGVEGAGAALRIIRRAAEGGHFDDLDGDGREVEILDRVRDLVGTTWAVRVKWYRRSLDRHVNIYRFWMRASDRRTDGQ
jgi:hypothetical protein